MQCAQRGSCRCLAAARKTRREKQAAYKSRAVSAPDRLRAVSRASSDDELLRSIGERDQDAMEVLFTRHSVRVFRFASSITNSPALADDVVSDVFFDVWRRPGSLKGKCQVSTWLWPSRATRLFRLCGAGCTSPDRTTRSDHRSPNGRAEVVIERKQIRRLSGRLPTEIIPIHREIVDLVYYHEKSIEAVAEILQDPNRHRQDENVQCPQISCGNARRQDKRREAIFALTSQRRTCSRQRGYEVSTSSLSAISLGWRNEVMRPQRDFIYLSRSPPPAMRSRSATNARAVEPRPSSAIAQ